MLGTVYLVDDNPIFLFTAKKMFQLRECQCNIQTFANGAQAIENLILLEATNSPMPNLVLLDINMPIMDGWEFLDALQKTGIQNLPIYLLTSSVDPADIERAKTYNMLNGYLTKPLTMEIIDEVEATLFP